MTTEAIQKLDTIGARVAAPDVITRIRSDIMPIITRTTSYLTTADAAKIINADDARAGARTCDAMAADIDAVKKHADLNGIRQQLHKWHRDWTGLIGEISGPIEAARQTLRTKIIGWEHAEHVKALALAQAKQREADAEAQAEKARLEAAFKRARSPEKRAELAAEVASVAAPIITITPEKSGMRTSLRWRAEVVDMAAFLTACAHDRYLLSAIEIKTSVLARMRSNDNTLEISGVKFTQERV